MANPVTIPGDLVAGGALKGLENQAPTRRSTIIQDLSQAYALKLTEFRVWDAFQTVLTTAATDDLGLTAGTFASGCPYITAGDQNGLGATTRYARTLFQLPPEYDAGQAIVLRFAAGVLTNPCATSCTIDVEAYLVGRDTLKSGSDLVTTTAQNCNSTSFANYDFVLAQTGRVAGEWLDLRLTVAANHNSTGTSSIPVIAAADVLLTIRG